MDDPNKLDLINNLNNKKLFQISNAFSQSHTKYKTPRGKVDIETFFNIMKEVLGDTSLIERESFITDLVDLFYRCKKKKGKLLPFEDLTSYLIEHEIGV